MSRIIVLASIWLVEWSPSLRSECMVLPYLKGFNINEDLKFCLPWFIGHIFYFYIFSWQIYYKWYQRTFLGRVWRFIFLILNWVFLCKESRSTISFWKFCTKIFMSALQTRRPNIFCKKWKNKSPNSAQESALIPLVIDLTRKCIEMENIPKK